MTTLLHYKNAMVRAHLGALTTASGIASKCGTLPIDRDISRSIAGRFRLSN
jgi:hypothetical protein